MSQQLASTPRFWTDTHASSAAMDWRTPPALFARLDAEFAFTLDAASDDDNHLCADYFTEADDALSRPWSGRVWLNPPYGRQLGRWVAKAHDEVRSGHCALVVLLIPARTDTAYWHEHVMLADEIRLLRGRIKFLDHTGQPTAPAPFPSALVLFDGSRPATAPLAVRSWQACEAPA